MTTAEILGRFGGLKALVAGDICLDRWCSYDPKEAEPSRETGIPRIAVVSVETTPGAGGTVANNLASLGVGRVAVLGAIGDDGFGYELRAALRERGIEDRFLAAAAGLQTFTYTKLLNRSRDCEEDQPRIDFINTRPISAQLEEQFARTLRDAAPEFDVILVSDQAETEQGGVVTAAVREAIGAVARQYPQKVVWVDSRMRPELFREVIVKPNQDEADAACQRLFGKRDYRALRRVIGPRPLIVTRSGEGALVVDDSGERLVAGRMVSNPVDICGAGDSFSAGAALALAVTGSPEEAARFGNLVASITIMKKGTGSATPAELLAAQA